MDRTTLHWTVNWRGVSPTRDARPDVITSLTRVSALAPSDPESRDVWLRDV